MKVVFLAEENGDVALKISSLLAVIVNASHVSTHSSVLRTALELKSNQEIYHEGKAYHLHDISALGSEQGLSYVVRVLEATAGNCAHPLSPVRTEGRPSSQPVSQPTSVRPLTSGAHVPGSHFGGGGGFGLPAGGAHDRQQLHPGLLVEHVVEHHADVPT